MLRLPTPATKEWSVEQLARVTMKARPSGEVRLCLVPVDSPKRNAPGALLSIASDSKTEVKRSQPAGFGVLTHGIRKFTAHARAKVRDVAATLEHEYGEACWFITLTLPGSTRDALRACAAWSAYLMERVRQYLRDTGFPNDVVAVWELQRRGALHMHLAVPRVSQAHVSPTPFGLHRMWCSVLQHVSTTCGVDLFARATGGTWKDRWEIVRSDIQIARKSVARYLSKYISKGCAMSAEKAGFYPTRWWSTSRSLCEKSLALTRLWVSPTMSITQCGELYEQMAGTICGAAEKAYPIASVFQPTRRSVSMWGSAVLQETARSAVSAFSRVTNGESWYDSATTHDRKTPSPFREGVFHWCWHLLEAVPEGISLPCRCASPR